MHATLVAATPVSALLPASRLLLSGAYNAPGQASALLHPNSGKIRLTCA